MLSELGMASDQAKLMAEFALRTHGLILIVGPTGSGKTTTIYSFLSQIDTRTRSLLSVEDPVEYRISYANQQQVNEKAGVTFETLLKSAMRQDPDILFLGEIRDPHSARTALDFASTGHLTISTLHTSNATTAIFRLERLGIPRETARRVLPLLGGSVEPAAGNLEAWAAEREWVLAAVARMTPAETVAVGRELVARASARREASVPGRMPAGAKEPAGGRQAAGGKAAAEGEEPGADEEVTAAGRVTGAERNLQVVELLRPVLWLYRDALVWRATGREELLSGVAPAGVVRGLADGVSRQGLEKSLAELLGAEVELRKLNPALQLAAVLVELVRQRDERTISVAGR
jgi:hypothetical protein